MALLSIFRKCLPTSLLTNTIIDDDHVHLTNSTSTALTNHTTTTTESSLSLFLNHVQVSLKSILPNRCHEPTGPITLIFDMLLALFVPCGASRSTINKLPQFTVTCQQLETNPMLKQKCSICLGPYQLQDTVRQLGCNHIFHSECVDAWLEKRSLCPICKVESC